MKKQKNISLLTSLRLITVAGSLCMVYIVCVQNPIATDFYKELGANELHFGLIGGLPIFMLSFQFVGAFLTNRVRKRKFLFMILIIAGRMVYIPIALMPLIFPGIATNLILWIIIAMIALSSAMSNTTGPLWFSWMADLVPRRVLNHYWGTRQSWMFFSWSATFIWIIIYTYFFEMPIKYAFPLIAIPGVIAGLIDILLFIWVDEPANTITHDISFLQTLMEPLKHKDFRSFLIFISSRSAALLCAAAFMQIYLLKVLQIDVWKLSLIWAFAGMGMILSSKKWGKTADRLGQKPIIIFCTMLKPIITVVFIFLTAENTIWLLPLFFLFDGFWNAGNEIAINGYMLKVSPRKNRSMFIAAVIALSGICGGIAAIIAGIFLKSISDLSWNFAGKVWNNYQILFLLSFIFRIICIFLAIKIKEPASKSTLHIFNDIRGTWPLRFLRFPIGFYRFNAIEEDSEK